MFLWYLVERSLEGRTAIVQVDQDEFYIFSASGVDYMRYDVFRSQPGYAATVRDPTIKIKVGSRT